MMNIRDISIQRVLALSLSLATVVLITSCERPADHLGLPAELSEIGSRVSVATYPVEQMDLLVELESEVGPKNISIDLSAFSFSLKMAALLSAS